MDPSAAAKEIAGLARDAMVVLVHVAAALSQMAMNDPETAAGELTVIVNRAAPGRYADEALYWRARIAGAQGNANARAAAAKDYAELLRRLPKGSRRREARVLLAAITEPGRVLTAEEAARQSARTLAKIGRALHAYAADHGRRLPGALHDLLDGYVEDAGVLVRPGRSEHGGGRPYAYRPGLMADLKSQRESEDPSARVGYANATVPVVWEPVAVARAEGAAPTRLVLRLDGEVRSVQERRPQAGGRDPAPERKRR